MNEPTLEGYLEFLRNIVGLTTTVLPNNSYYIEWSYRMSVNLVWDVLRNIPSPPDQFLYEQAVYNLGADFLLGNAVDVSGQDFFAKYQQKYNLRAFVGGVIESASDETTSSSMVVPEAFNNLTIQNLQSLKTPYGRMYLSIVQSLGSLSLMNIA
jgi:hypothetical protein